ncbi:hypothetical protein [Pseudomonas matsuisoli]|uniref:Uncharacterized protein n=1 Tax=Pseudomonas matsuisoli TaxID=1515666 RepID=A0A917PNB0_9PSED|nr:hypothetical protein [Pseudomonas matsuisoli]GGJ85344.1 hypothetical protein GCM10009304_09210 [Pseudomonas matsuisoli]
MSFADCMNDLEKMNEYSDVVVKAPRASFFETIVKKVSRALSARPVAQHIKN